MKKLIKWALMPPFATGAFTYHNLNYLCIAGQTYGTTLNFIKRDCRLYVGEVL